MLQRIQSIYLLLVSIVSGGLIFITNLWKNENSAEIGILSLLKNHHSLLKLSIGILFFVVAALALISIFYYSNRKVQIILNRINIIINFILLGLLVYILLNVSGETPVSEKGIGSFLPLVSIVLLVFANRAIQKDEDLVKSVDRIR